MVAIARLSLCLVLNRIPAGAELCTNSNFPLQITFWNSISWYSTSHRACQGSNKKLPLRKESDYFLQSPYTIGLAAASNSEQINALAQITLTCPEEQAEKEDKCCFPFEKIMGNHNFDLPSSVLIDERRTRSKHLLLVLLLLADFL